MCCPLQAALAPTLHTMPCAHPQPARTRKQKLLLFCKRLLGFVLSHWSKVVILAVIITLIVLVAVKARGLGSWA